MYTYIEHMNPCALSTEYNINIHVYNVGILSVHIGFADANWVYKNSRKHLCKFVGGLYNQNEYVSICKLSY